MPICLSKFGTLGRKIGLMCLLSPLGYLIELLFLSTKEFISVFLIKVLFNSWMQACAMNELSWYGGNVTRLIGGWVINLQAWAVNELWGQLCLGLIHLHSDKWQCRTQKSSVWCQNFGVLCQFFGACKWGFWYYSYWLTTPGVNTIIIQKHKSQSIL